MNLLSIGRYTYAKNYDNVPYIMKELLKSCVNKDIKWFIIGFGSDEQLIKSRIKDAGMSKNVFLLGKKSNPYPYIKACDIYIQPSRYEGKSVVVREAQILCKPVVITNYATATDQIKNGVDGVIVPLDNEGCASGLADFIRNKDLQKSIVSYLKTHDYGNESEVEKIYNLLK